MSVMGTRWNGTRVRCRFAETSFKAGATMEHHVDVCTRAVANVMDQGSIRIKNGIL